MKRLGPDLKMPDLKVPDVLTDLFYDLHDRRLLAPIVLVIVAIAAVPFLLSDSSDESPPPPVAGAATPAELEAAKAPTLTVVESKPGLRDYRKRLAARQPTNPFKQRYTSPQVESAELNPQTESSSSSSTTVTNSSSSEATTISTETTTTAPGGSPSSTPTSQPAPSGGGNGNQHLTFFAWSVDVWISKAGGKDADPNAEPETNAKHRVLPQTPLPGEKAPVVTYMGLSRKAAQKDNAGRALLLVSDDVKSISGAPRCVSRGEGDVCQLIEVEPGLPITFIYGANETRYTIKVLKIDLVVTGHS